MRVGVTTGRGGRPHAPDRYAARLDGPSAVSAVDRCNHIGGAPGQGRHQAMSRRTEAPRAPAAPAGARLRHVLRAGLQRDEARRAADGARAPSLERRVEALRLGGDRTPIGAGKRAHDQTTLAPTELDPTAVPYYAAYRAFVQHYLKTMEEMKRAGMWLEDAAGRPWQTDPMTWDDKWWPPLRDGPDKDARPLGISVYIKRRPMPSPDAAAAPVSEGQWHEDAALRSNIANEWKGCEEWAIDHQYVFYIHGGVAGLLSGGPFLNLLGQTPTVQAYPSKTDARGYVELKEWPMWEISRGWRFTSVLLSAEPRCALVAMQGPNWGVAALWHAAARAANEQLRRDYPHATRVVLWRGGARMGYSGVIGWDVRMTAPDWLQGMFPDRRCWESPYFPQLQDGMITFHRGGQSPGEATRMLSTIAKHAPFKGRVHPALLHLDGRAGASAGLHAFLAMGTPPFAVAGWGMHARIFVRDDAKRVVRVYDPWQQCVDIPAWMRDAARGRHPPFEVQFVPRMNRDQQMDEGSCVLQAIARVMAAAIYGEGAISKPWSAQGKRAEWLAIPVAVQILADARTARDAHDPAEWESDPPSAATRDEWSAVIPQLRRADAAG